MHVFVFIFLILVYRIAYSFSSLKLRKVFYYFSMAGVQHRPRDSNIVSNVNITKTMINIVFSRNPNFLKLCHFNAQSLNPKNHGKLDELRNIFNNSALDIIGVSESWLKQYVTDKSVEMDGYKIFRNDRNVKRGGGVALYVRKDLRCSVVAKSIERSNHSNFNPSQLTSMEYATTGIQFLFVELFVNSRKLLLGIVYNPKPLSFSNRENLGPVLEFLSPRYEDIILIGDFNTNILRHDQNVQDFINLLDSFALYNVSNEPTHFTYNSNNSSSCIDLIITNRLNGVSNFHQLDFPGISNHDLLLFNYDIPISNVNVPPIYIRDYKSIDFESASRAILQYPWIDFYCLASTDDLTRYLTKAILDLFDLHVPIRQIRPKANQHPWFNRRIENLVHRRNQAYRIWIRTRSVHSHESFKRIRNDVNQSIRDAKTNYFNRTMPINSSSRELWRKLRNAGISSKPIVDIPFNPNFVNDELLRPVNVLASGHTHLNTSFGVENPSGNPVSLSFSNVTNIDVSEAICSIDSNSIGFDEVPLKFIKLFLPFFAPLITHLFNFILSTSSFPTSWKIGKIIPIPKNSFPKTVNDLRPITILSCLSKAFEKLVMKQINSYLTDNRMLHSFQSGFRVQHSTETALLCVSDDIRSELDEKKVSVLAMLDFSKAFDTVNHGLLLQKLEQVYFFSTTAVQLINSYLSHRHQIVQIAESVSDVAPITAGVPQGSILGPLLFSMFINDLPNVIRNSKIHMFADDVQLYASDKKFRLNELTAALNNDLLSVARWAEENCLQLNPGKSVCILFCSKNPDEIVRILPPISMQGANIPVVTHGRDLGVIFDSCLTWNKHVDVVCGKVYGILRSLWCTAFYIPQHVKSRLVKTLVMPHFNYCYSVMGNNSKANLNKLTKAMNACVRYVYKIPRYASISRHVKTFLGCPLSVYFKYRICMTLHKILKYKKPDYLYERLNFGSSDRRRNLIIPRNRTSFKNDSIFVFGTSLYNSLPSRLKELSVNQFKLKCFDFWCNS